MEKQIVVSWSHIFLCLGIFSHLLVEATREVRLPSDMRLRIQTSNTRVASYRGKFPSGGYGGGTGQGGAVGSGYGGGIGQGGGFGTGGSSPAVGSGGGVGSGFGPGSGCCGNGGGNGYGTGTGSGYGSGGGVGGGAGGGAGGGGYGPGTIHNSGSGIWSLVKKLV